MGRQTARASSFSHIKFDSKAAGEAARWALARYKHHGVRLPGGNRVEKAAKLFENLASGRVSIGQHPEQSLLEKLHDAHVTFLEHYISARALGFDDHPVSDRLRKKVQTTLAGAELEVGDKHPHARNFQFELYVGSMLTMGGADVGLDEPDLRMNYLGEVVGIAAKRTTSPSEFRNRAESAQGQIKKHGLRGFVALNADRLASQGGLANRPIGMLVPGLREIDDYLQEHEHVLGRMVFGRESGWDLSGSVPRVVLGFRYQLRTFADTIDDQQRAEAFFKPLMARIHARYKEL